MVAGKKGAIPERRTLAKMQAGGWIEGSHRTTV